MPWRRRHDERTPQDRFVEEMAGLVQTLLGAKVTKAPDFALEIERGPGEPPVVLNLQNVYAEAQRLTGEPRAARLRTAVLAMAPQPRPSTWPEAAPKLLPGIRAASWVAVSGPVPIVRRPLAPFLSVICTIDFEHAMTYVTADDLKQWDTGEDDAFDTAIDNLSRMPVQVGRAGSALFVLGPDGYISSWLGASSRLAQLAGEVGDRVIALAPSRDALLLVDTSDEAAVVEHVRRVIQEYQVAPRHLSPDAYLVLHTGVTPWHPPDGHAAAPLVDRARHLLAASEYGRQQQKLQQLFGNDVFVAHCQLFGQADNSLVTWTVWLRQGTGVLIPRADVVVLCDADDPGTSVAIRWEDAMGVAGQALVRAPGYDPPLWRYSGWPDPATLAALRERAVPWTSP